MQDLQMVEVKKLDLIYLMALQLIAKEIYL
jgi:hypothetical protein